jgi:4-hydroxybenzoate polyprenyltransferase
MVTSNINIQMEVGTIMSILALCSGTPLEPLPLLYIMASARWAYGADRYLDGKTEDTPESIAAALLTANLILWYTDQSKYIAPEILCILLYPSFKRKLPLLKPFYVGTFWAGAISVVPHLIAHTDVIENETIAMGLLASSVSNMADIEDVEDDIKNGIYTIPTRIGILPTKALSAGLFLGSVYKSGIRLPHALPTRNVHRPQFFSSPLFVSL